MELRLRAYRWLVKADVFQMPNSGDAHFLQTRGCSELSEPIPYRRGTVQNLWSLGPDQRAASAKAPLRPCRSLEFFGLRIYKCCSKPLELRPRTASCLDAGLTKAMPTRGVVLTDLPVACDSLVGLP